MGLIFWSCLVLVFCVGLLFESLVSIGIYSRSFMTTEVWKPSKEHDGRVLFITAHPDDEAMFFAPTILSLRDRGVRAHLLCLSIGGSEERKSELLASSKVIGLLDEESNGQVTVIRNQGDISSLNLTRLFIVDLPSFIDGQNWNVEELCDLLEDFLRNFPHFEFIYTFDEYGISGHQNHRAIYTAMVELKKRRDRPEKKKKMKNEDEECSENSELRIFALSSTNRVRKYLGVFVYAYTSFMEVSYYRIPDFHIYTPYKAFLEHKSQWTYYRFLYIFFSRYSYINEYEEL